MTTNAEIVGRLENVANDAEYATKAYKEVLVSDGDKDILLVDGSTTPNLNKRVRLMLENQVIVTPVINSLDSTATGVALSAAMGKKLNDEKLGKTENAVSASVLKTPRTVSFSGAATGSFAYSGAENSTAALTLANSGVTAGAYGSVKKIPVLTVNNKGLVTAAATADLLEATTNQSGLVQLDNTLTSSSDKHALSAAMGKKLNDEKLGLSGGEVDGVLAVSGTITAKQRINIGRLDTVNQERTFAVYSTGMGVKFAIRSRVNGALDFTDATSYSFDKPVKTDLDGNANTATSLATPRKINGVDFDGSKDIETPVFGATNGLVPARLGSTSDKFLNENGKWLEAAPLMTEAEVLGGTSQAGRFVNAALLKKSAETWGGGSGGGVVRSYKRLIIQDFNKKTNLLPYDIWVSIPVTLNGLTGGRAVLQTGHPSKPYDIISILEMGSGSKDFTGSLVGWIPSGFDYRVNLTGATVDGLPQEYS